MLVKDYMSRHPFMLEEESSIVDAQRYMGDVRDVIIVDENTAIEDAAMLMIENKIGCLPVLKGQIVVGIITQEDLLVHLCRLLVTRRPGLRIAVSMPDAAGETRKLTDCIMDHGWEIQTVAGMPDPEDETRYSTMVKIIADVSMDEVEGIINQIEGQKVRDIRETA